MKGTLLLAREGINGTIAGSRAGIDSVITWLRSDRRLADLDWKESHHIDTPFHRMKVKLKREIVTMGVDDVDPTVCVGRYATPEKWNALLDDPECLVIDTRNDYEVAIGTFRGLSTLKQRAFVIFRGGRKKTWIPKSTARSQCFAQAEFAAKSRRLILCLKGLTRSGTYRVAYSNI